MLLGKFLRIDINVPDSHPQGFVVPAGNAGLARPEIWSLGWRNPWRFSFDPPALGGTGAMLVADVGQDAYEEIDYEPAGRGGRNYGWKVREGAHPYPNGGTTTQPLVDPIYDYDHGRARSITGGYISPRVRHPCAPGALLLRGLRDAPRMVARTSRERFGRSVAGAARRHRRPHDGARRHETLGGISAFGMDAVGELYIVSYSSGTILKIVGSLTLPAPPTSLRIVR